MTTIAGQAPTSPNPVADNVQPAPVAAVSAAASSDAIPATADPTAATPMSANTNTAEPKAVAAAAASDAPAAAAATKDPKAENVAKSSTSTTNEKKPVAAASAPTTRAPAPAKPASKKRRKRGGLAGIFVALGCMSSDDFEDAPPNKAAPPANATVKPAGSSLANKADPAKPNATGAAQTKEVSTLSSTTPANPSVNTGIAAAKMEGASTPDGANSSVVVPSREPTTPPLEETAGLTSGAVQAPGSGSEIIHQHMLHRSESEHHLPHADTHAQKTDTSGGYTDLSDSDAVDESGHQEIIYGEEDYEDEEDRLIAQGGIGIPIDENGNPAPLLPVLQEQDKGRKCLVLDLDETLLHSSFKMLPSADYIVPVEIESQTHNVYVIKRPGVDHFLQEMGKIYEVVVFTASLSKYADPVLDMLDVGRVVRHRLFRESCYNHKGNYVKDLSQLGRDISTAIIIDNSPASYIFHPNNAVPVSTWFNDPHDTELTDLCPFLTDLATVDDIRGVLDGSI